MSDMIMAKNIDVFVARLVWAMEAECQFLAAPLLDVTTQCDLLGSRMSLRLCAGLPCCLSLSRTASFLAFQHVS